MLLAPPSPLQGNLTSLELRGSDQAGSLIASDEYRPARPRLTTPVALPAAFPEPSQGFSVTLLVRVAPDGRAESITVRDRPSKESVKPGGPAFADLVVKTVASWTFDPARRAGRPEGSLLPLSVSYSSHRVFRTTVAASESVVSPKVGEYLRSTFPLYVELPELHGFAVAGPLLEGEKGLINARAWFLRVGEESGRTWIAVASRTITARDPVNGIKCGCDLITDSEDAAGRLLSALTEHLGLPASSTTILMPTAGLIPGGLAEPEAKGSWGRDAVTGLLRAALGRSEQIRQGAGRTSDKDGGKPDELGMPLGAPSLPAAAAFAPSPEPTRINFDEVVDPPRLVRKVTPDYPVMARRARIEGDVVLEAWVDEGGHVRDIQIIKGLPLLNLPSIEAVSCWEYEPAHRNGKPLPVFFTIVVTYTLRGS